MLERLRPGDVLTHAFRPFPNSPATHQGTVKREVLEARKRGVKFDIGHGKGSFAFKTARAMLANGFLPDTISSDVHKLCINGPAFDQVTTLSKFLCLGMPLADVIAASTVNAALALKRPELGSLKPGSVGDATILTIHEGRFDYVDVVGEHLEGDRKIELGRRRRRRPLVAPAIAVIATVPYAGVAPEPIRTSISTTNGRRSAASANARRTSSRTMARNSGDSLTYSWPRCRRRRRCR